MTYCYVGDDVEGPNGEWLGSEDAACTIRGPIETTVRLNNTIIRVSGISEEKTLDMTTKVRITSEGAPLFENMNYLLMAEVVFLTITNSRSFGSFILLLVITDYIDI